MEVEVYMESGPGLSHACPINGKFMITPHLPGHQPLEVEWGQSNAAQWNSVCLCVCVYICRDVCGGGGGGGGCFMMNLHALIIIMYFDVGCFCLEYEMYMHGVHLRTGTQLPYYYHY